MESHFCFRCRQWSIFVFIILSCTLFITKSHAAEKITLAYVSFPPYEYQEDGKAEGVLVDIIKEIFQRANIPLELKFLPFKRAYVEAKEGRIDGLFNFYKNEERLSFLIIPRG